MTLRGSIFRAGYELFYTPLPEAAKRAAKSAVDVGADCFGKGAGAALIVLLTRLDPVYALRRRKRRPVWSPPGWNSPLPAGSGRGT